MQNTKTADPATVAWKIATASSMSVYRHQPCNRPNRAMAPSRIAIKTGTAENNSNRSGRKKLNRSSHARINPQKISSAENDEMNHERYRKIKPANFAARSFLVANRAGEAKSGR